MGAFGRHYAIQTEGTEDSNLCQERASYTLLPIIPMFWFRLPPATKAPRGRPSPRRRAEENEKNQAETGGSG